MAGGEYVSVSAQKDTEEAVLAKERWELATVPAEELAELAALYEQKGLAPDLAQEVAVQLHAHDPLAAHAQAELGLDPEERVSPWGAALASAVSFALGAMLPLLAITLTPVPVRVLLTGIVVVLALVGTGYVSATLGGAPRRRAIVRNVVMGVLAMVVTYGLGTLVGAVV